MAYPNYPNYFNPPQQSILWVQGIEGAKAYPVGAGNSVLLMDSDNQSMYIKSADQAGVPSLRIFEYTEVTGKKEEPKADYITREEFELALSKLAEKKKKKKREYDDEDDE